MKTRFLIILVGVIGVLLAGCTSSPTSKTISKEVTSGSSCGLDGNCPLNTEENKGIENENLIKIPFSEISSTVKHYSYNANGVTVNYFAVKGSDGKIRTAFDACDVCGGYKGYFQRGTDVVCRNCGRVFRIDDIGSKNRGGGCWPSYLSHKIEGNNILISKSELEQGAFRFK